MSARWMRIDSDFVDHPKVRRLCSELADPRAGWYVMRFWSYVSRFCPTGHLRDIDGTLIENACEWSGAPGLLVEKLVLCGLLDVGTCPTDWRAHDWDIHQGRVASSAQKEKERKAKYRQKLREGVPQLSHGTSHGTNGTGDAQRYETRRDDTKRDVLKALSHSATDAQAPKARKVKPQPADPRLKPLAEALVTQYLKARGTAYVHGGVKDVMALKRLLDNASPADIEAHWKDGLTRTGWTQVSTFAELARKWNDLSAPFKNTPPKTEVWKEGDGTYSEEIKF